VRRTDGTELGIAACSAVYGPFQQRHDRMVERTSTQVDPIGVRQFQNDAAEIGEIGILRIPNIPGI
jgi:hypothetical protein